MENLSINREVSEPDSKCSQEKFQYKLTVADNEVGIPENIDFQAVDFLGLKLVNFLVDQVRWLYRGIREKGTEVLIWFNNIE